MLLEDIVGSWNLSELMQDERKTGFLLVTFAKPLEQFAPLPQEMVSRDVFRMSSVKREFCFVRFTRMLLTRAFKSFCSPQLQEFPI